MAGSRPNVQLRDRSVITGGGGGGVVYKIVGLKLFAPSHQKSNTFHAPPF